MNNFKLSLTIILVLFFGLYSSTTQAGAKTKIIKQIRPTQILGKCNLSELPKFQTIKIPPFKPITIKPAPKPVIKPTPKPVIKPAPKPVIKPAPKPVIKPAPKPVIKPAPKPVIKPTVKPSNQPNSHTYQSIDSRRRSRTHKSIEHKKRLDLKNQFHINSQKKSQKTTAEKQKQTFLTNKKTQTKKTQEAKFTHEKYKVGEYKNLKKVSKNSGLDAHHVGQKAGMKRFVKGYDPKKAPSILVPKRGHTKSKHTLEGRKTVAKTHKEFGNARDLITRDIWELRRVYPNIPNSKLQKLIQKNKETYPSVLKKK